MAALAMTALAVGCGDGNGGIPNLTVGASVGATDAIPPDDSGSDRPNGSLGSLCSFNYECQTGYCFPLTQFDADPYAPAETDTVPPNDLPPGFDTDGVPQIQGICLQACETLLQCPELGWECNLDYKVCLPEGFPNSID
jgi:hypothetical protein